MSRLENQAERIKLEKLLGEAPETLSFLDRVSGEALSALRQQVTAMLYDDHAAMFERLAGTGKLLPARLQMLVAEKALGPMLCARVAGYSPVERAVAMAERMHVPFLADVAEQMDPRRVRPLLRGISLNRIRDTARELVRRDEVVVLGRFVDALPLTTIEAVMTDLDDDEVLLRVAFFADDRGHLAKVVRLLPEQRLQRLVGVAREKKLYREALALMFFVEPELSRELGDLAAREPGFLEDLMVWVSRQGLWVDALMVINRMGPGARSDVFSLPLLREDDTLRGLLDTLQRNDGWAHLASLRDVVPPELHARVAEMATDGQYDLPAELRP